MGNYQTQSREQEIIPTSKSTFLDYSPRLLEKALGFVKVFGMKNVPKGVIIVLDYAIRLGDLTQEQIDLAELRYNQEYAKPLVLEEMFT
jgi:hypothetical protein